MNLAERFDPHDAASVALVTKGRSITYGELADRVGRWHGGLEAAGLAVGDRVLIVAGNSEIAVLAYLACLSAGLIAVPVNPQSPGPELARDIAPVAPRAAIVDAAGLSAFESLPAETRAGIEVEMVADGGVIHDLEGGPVRPVRSVDGSEPAVLLFTSGTAGTPRPAVLTHDNLWASMQSMLAMGVPLKGEGHVLLGVIPLFHVFGLNVVVNLSLAVGATLVIDEYESPTHTAELVETNGVTIVAGPPTLWASLAADPSIRPDAFASVRHAVSGAAPLPDEVTAAVEANLGLRISEGYGLTETSGVLTSALGTDAPVGSVGLVAPGVEVRLIDGHGHDVLVGDPGELLARGPMISPGYWNDPEATEASRTADGWLATGDLAVVDDHGYVSIVDRIKDLIIVSGFNVHPAEVEAVLNQHPAVSVSAVLGRPDDRTGERVTAHVVLEPGAQATESDLIEACRTGLARYKVPTAIHLVDELPTGIGGKLRRGAVDAGA